MKAYRWPRKLKKDMQKWRHGAVPTPRLLGWARRALHRVRSLSIEQSRARLALANVVDDRT